MNLHLRGHAALIQGGSRGLGFGIAQALAAEGVDLLLTARGKEALDAAAESLRAEHKVRVETMIADSADLSATRKSVDAAAMGFGRLDIVVANSGGPPPGLLTDLSEEKWRAAFELLLMGPNALLQQALPHLAKSPAPRFFVVTSSSTKVPVPGLTLSNVLRPAVVAWIKAVAAEYGPQRLRAHSLAPGRFDTERLGHVISAHASRSGRDVTEVREGMVAAIPAGRFGEPLELGHLAAFLSSPQADYLTGQNWLVDGGLTQAN